VARASAARLAPAAITRSLRRQAHQEGGLLKNRLGARKRNGGVLIFGPRRREAKRLEICDRLEGWPLVDLGWTISAAPYGAL
jgi:hypothetical protein